MGKQFNNTSNFKASSKTECCRCQYFDKYYTRGVKQYNPTKLGMCTINKEDRSLHEHCEKFRVKQREKMLRFSVAIALNNLLAQITEINDVIKKELIDNEEM